MLALERGEHYRTLSVPRSENVSFEYPSIFSHQMDAIVFIIVQIIFATRVVWKIGEYSRIFPSFSWRIFGHVTCSDQSRASENSWWIIRSIICPQCSYRRIQVSTWSFHRWRKKPMASPIYWSPYVCLGFSGKRLHEKTKSEAMPMIKFSSWVFRVFTMTSIGIMRQSSP